MGKTRTEITSDINNMKQYLKDIYLLEKEIYCSERAKQKITDTINSLGKRENILISGRQLSDIEREYYLRTGYHSDKVYWDIFEILSTAFLGAGIGLFVGGVLSLLITRDWANFFRLTLLIIFICAIIGGITEVKEQIIRNRYENEAKRASIEKLKQDEERVKKELERIPAYRANENLYSQNISACKNTLKQLYDLDIIFSKYRNFIAISQIYEYYMSGRCTELEGHEGAYNIYESEVRQNVIIIQLNAVLANLQEIKQTQYMIYDAICEANSRLAHIESNTEAIAYNTAVIAENSEICARYYN